MQKYYDYKTYFHPSTKKLCTVELWNFSLDEKKMESYVMCVWISFQGGEASATPSTQTVQETEEASTSQKRKKGLRTKNSKKKTKQTNETPAVEGTASKRVSFIKHRYSRYFSNNVSMRDDPYWTSRKDSLELIELSSINKVSLV